MNQDIGINFSKSETIEASGSTYRIGKTEFGWVGVEQVQEIVVEGEQKEQIRGPTFVLPPQELAHVLFWFEDIREYFEEQIDDSNL